ncbi:hypothetical protein Zmor_012585 [Zophobas morio]|uniref:Uncharacterized protein n=1 Tax=Zophobas morio TaxID=2755281 RepID=A0AA38IDV8_9CUCU|nr:hypothetical protein Zmor_012585 [Zophobas morio]
MNPIPRRLQGSLPLAPIKRLNQPISHLCTLPRSPSTAPPTPARLPFGTSQPFSAVFRISTVITPLFRDYHLKRGRLCALFIPVYLHSPRDCQIYGSKAKVHNCVRFGPLSSSLSPPGTRDRKVKRATGRKRSIESGAAGYRRTLDYPDSPFPSPDRFWIRATVPGARPTLQCSAAVAAFHEAAPPPLAGRGGSTAPMSQIRRNCEALVRSPFRGQGITCPISRNFAFFNENFDNQATKLFY